MSNILSFPAPAPRPSLTERAGLLIKCFATQRRFGEDVFWMKENAETLNILECTNIRPKLADLASHVDFYADLPQRLSFFPQYYRFLLSLCLDLEDLGMPGNQGTDMCKWAANAGLHEAELSDLQRAEARRLLARRGVDTTAADPGLDTRLHAFINRSDTFALPNKKAAYELTHIVFYLSEYGRCDPKLDPAAITSLEFAGVLAFLDQNTDLLAEVCVALRYAGHTPSAIWEDHVMGVLDRFDLSAGTDGDVADDYHCYLVSTWLSAVRGDTRRGVAIPDGRVRFCDPGAHVGPLRGLSAAMFNMQGLRSPDWAQMRPMLEETVDETGLGILELAERSTDKFQAFFEGFARATPALG